MGGMTMWIILGGLIGVVVIFLLVTTTLDRKKKKRVKIEKAELAKGVESSGTNISKKVTRLVAKNKKLLDNFVPSIGKFKMSDINKKAKDELKVIKESEDFKLIKHMEKEYVKFEKHTNNLIENKSNNWDKNNKDDISFFKEYKFVPEKKEVSKKGKKKGKK